jgi:hypothetical protein
VRALELIAILFTLAAKVEETLGPRLDNIEQEVGITLALAAAG